MRTHITSCEMQQNLIMFQDANEQENASNAPDTEQTRRIAAALQHAIVKLIGMR